MVRQLFKLMLGQVVELLVVVAMVVMGNKELVVDYQVVEVAQLDWESKLIM